MTDFFNLSTQDNIPVINIRGNIGHNWWDGEIDAESFKFMLDSIDVNAPKIKVDIASQGGNVSLALSIYNMLREHNAEIITTVYSEASSSASFIFLAGDERIMLTGTSIFIHEPLSVLGLANADSMLQSADYLNTIADSILDIYVERTGGDRETLKQLMKKETLMNAEESERRGFATKVMIPDNVVVNCTDRTVFNKQSKEEYEDMEELLNQIKALADSVTALNNKVDAQATVVEPVVATVVEPVVATVVEPVALTKLQLEEQLKQHNIENRNNNISAICTAAGKSEAAEHYIKSNVTVNQVMKDMVDLTVNDNAIEIDSTVPAASTDKVTKSEIQAGWKKAYQ